ncbi:hypothetical protein FRB97_004552 [Tulasnella sp. 331]|nr:hypothetical protein FRB97_004552 [Tulasnella sp. 331]
MPRHLLSAALLQRHYFLSIDHDDDPASYFLLPKEEPDLAHGIVLALEQIATYDVDHTIEEIEYLVDGDERLQARITLMGQLQVVFVLESRTEEPQSAGEVESTSAMDSTEWRYNDVILRAKDRKLGYATVELALASQIAAPELTESAGDIPAEQMADEFWDGWDEPEEQEKKTNIVQDTRLGSEDQYYARYADVETVAGTALNEDDINLAPQRQRTQAKDEAVQNIVRGAYHLWKSNTEVSTIGLEEDQTRAFLSLVASAIEGL